MTGPDSSADAPKAATRSRRLRSRARAPRFDWLWLLPFALALLMRAVLELGLVDMFRLVAIGAGTPVLVALARRPHVPILLLVVLLPFQLVLTSLLYELGLPGGLVFNLSLWKELAAASLVAAAAVVAMRTRRHHDALDKVAMAYVVLGTVYLVGPELLIGDEIGASLSVDDRLVGWRVIVLPALLLVTARQVRLAPEHLRRLLRAASGVGLVLGAIAVFEFVFSSTWNTFMVDTIGVNRFRVEVLDANLVGPLDDIRRYGDVAGREIVRVGGPMADYLTLSFALLVAGGIMIERLVRGVRSRMSTVAAALAGAGLLFTQTRSALVGGVLLVVAALRPAPGRSEASRIRYTILAVTGFAIALPLMFGTGMLDRFTEGDEQSDDFHEESFDVAFEVVRSTPLGRGLTTGAVTGTADVPGAITAENQFLDIGIQLGWTGLVLYVAMLALMIITLQRSASRTHDPTAQLGLLGVQGAFIALLVPCWFLHPLITPEVTWVVFALAGASLGTADRTRAEQRAGSAPVERLAVG